MKGWMAGKKTASFGDFMHFYTELRLRGDSFCGRFSNGLSMTCGPSTEALNILEERDGVTVYLHPENCLVECHYEKDGDITRLWTVFRNQGSTPVTLELLSSFAVSGLRADKIHRLRSFWSAEGRLTCEDLTEMEMEPSWSKGGLRCEKFGQTGSMPVRKWFPWLVLEDSKTAEFTGFQLGWAGSWQMEIFRHDDPISVCGGLADFDFGHWAKIISPGESFITPKAVCAHGKSLEEVCHRLTGAQHPRISPADEDLPIIFNEFCTTWGNPTLENLTRIADKLQGTGVKYLVIDCGWYKDTDRDWSISGGDWVPSRELFPDGLKAAADMIQNRGMVPGIWFEMETVGCESRAYRRTEHLLKRDGVPITTGARRFWDMEDPWVVDYLSERVIGQLQDNGFGYLKVDYNESFGMGCDGAESLGEGLRRKIEASQNFFRKITAELPELTVENCSSGGHRLEPSMMELVSQASFSDAHECQSIPVIAANLHRAIQPRQSQIWCVLRENDSFDRLRYSLSAAMLGRMCLSGDIFSLTDKQWAVVREGMDFYTKIRHIIKNGFTEKIICTTHSYNCLTGYQAVLRTLADEALLVVHTFARGANPPLEKILKPYTVKAVFGSALDMDFQGQACLLKRICKADSALCLDTL